MSYFLGFLCPLTGLTDFLDYFERKRQGSVRSHFATMSDTLSLLSGNNNQCSYECTAILLGCLVKHMRSHGLFPQQPTEPFIGYSYENTQELLWSAREPKWCGRVMDKSGSNTCRAHSPYSTHGRHQCSLASLLRGSAKERSIPDGMYWHICIL